jgi:hypothetical protein
MVIIPLNLIFFSGSLGIIDQSIVRAGAIVQLTL